MVSLTGYHSGTGHFGPVRENQVNLAQIGPYYLLIQIKSTCLVWQTIFDQKYCKTIHSFGAHLPLH